MKIDILTIFPDFFRGPLDYGILRRAQEGGLVEVSIHDLREFTRDKHRTVDDRPFGGGEGMVLKPEPIFECLEPLQVASREQRLSGAAKESVILLSAQGERFTQKVASELAALDRMVLICGRYEGVDDRVAEHLATEEVSVGDYVLSGGELPAAIVLDAVTRLLPGAVGNEASTQNESFSGEGAEDGLAAETAVGAGEPRALLDFPHYTRPADFRGWKVPEVLIGGNHAEVAKWRRKVALEKTKRNRPDLFR
jgi:tRNA (guanine37-N1)-methyltransferase